MDGVWASRQLGTPQPGGVRTAVGVAESLWLVRMSPLVQMFFLSATSAMTIEDNMATTFNNSNSDLAHLISSYLHEQDIVNNPFKLSNINCNYNEIIDIAKNANKEQFKSVHWNIQGLSSKFDELKFLLSQFSDCGIRLDCIMLCETFINDNNAYLFDIPGFNFIFKNRKLLSKGGVAIYIRNDIQYKLREDLSTFYEGEFESVFIEIIGTKSPIILGEIYRTPSSDVRLSLERYMSLLNKFTDCKIPVMIGTDQNFDYMKIFTNNNISVLLDSYFDANFIPTITKPTRIFSSADRSSATLIDNIYVKNTNLRITSGIICYDKSDHLPIFCFIDKCKSHSARKDPLIFKHRPMPTSSLQLISAAIRENSWTCLDGMSAEMAFSNFSDQLNTIINTFAPEKTVVIPPKFIIREEWMTKGLMTSSSTCQKLYRGQMGKAKNDPLTTKYISYRNYYNKLKTVAKNMHYKKRFSEIKNDAKKMWKELGALIGKTNEMSSGPLEFRHNNEVITNPKHISNQFCDFFTNVGPNYARDIPNSHKEPFYYLSRKQNRNPSSFFLHPTDEHEVSQIIKSFSPKKSTGHDGISSYFIKNVGRDIALPISVLINKSLCEGYVPDMLKIAKVISIYKSKSKDSFSNYRPISLLPSISKILEKIVHKRTYTFLSHCNIFSKTQYGFRENHSTINAATKFLIDTVSALNNRESTLSVFLDLSKAFDTIDHDILLNKLEYYGIRGVPLKWFKSYLSNRTQYVQYHNENSDRMNIICGVPQGSVLGPLLFVIYVNDLSSSLDNSNSIQFADDTTVYISGKNKPALYAQMNGELNILTDWFYSNKLSLNVSKTNYMFFSNSQEHSATDQQLKMANVTIDRTNCFKLLGLYIDEQLNWSEHIKRCQSKLSSALYAFHRVKGLIPIECLKMLYYTLVYPHLTYGIVLWGATHKTYIERLYRSQKKILRAMYSATFFEHSHPLFSQLKILKIEDIYNIEVSKFMYKHSINDLPIDLSNLFQHTSNIHGYGTRQSTDIRPFNPRINIFLNSILCKGPNIWNVIANDIKQLRGIRNFTSALRGDVLLRYERSVAP